MSATNKTSVILTGALIGAAALGGIATGMFRALGYVMERKRWLSTEETYLNPVYEEVRVKPLLTKHARFALPSPTRGAIFLNASKPQQTAVPPSLSFSLENFESAVKALSLSAKWPLCYMEDESERREAERLALYLMGSVYTFMADGPYNVVVTPSLQLSISLLYFCAANLGIQEAFTVPIPRPRTAYGLLSYAEKSECKAARIVDQDLKHAMKNSVITLYELIILFLMQIGEWEGALTLLAQIRPSPYSRLFSAYAHLALKDFPEYIKTLRSINLTGHSYASTMTTIKALESIQNIEAFPLPALSSILFDPFTVVE